MSKPIKTGIIRCDTHGMYYAALMGGHDPLKLQRGTQVDDDPPYSWQNGSVQYYFYGFCADPRTLTVETVDGFEVTRVWDVHRAAAEEFSAALDSRPRVCDSFAEVSDDVDLLFLADCNEDGSDHLELAAPGLEKGVATFIDKPLANETADAQALVALAKKNDAPLFSASILRHHPDALRFRARLGDVGPVDCGHVRGLSGHIAGMIHGVSLAQAVFGGGIEQVRAMGPGDLGVCHLSWGEGAGGPPSGVVIQVGKAHHHCSMHVSACGPRGAIMDENNIDDWSFPAGAAEILRLVREMVHTGKVDDSMNDMIEAVAVVNAARLSQAEGGRAVALTEVTTHLETLS